MPRKGLASGCSPRWANTELFLLQDFTHFHLSNTGLAENSLDSLVFESLIPKPILQRYVSLLVEHRRIILSGPSGTGKTYLANRLSEYLVLREGRELTDGVIATFNVDHKSSKVRRRSFGGGRPARGHSLALSELLVKQHFLHAHLGGLYKPCEEGQTGSSRKQGFGPKLPTKTFHL